MLEIKRGCKVHKSALLEEQYQETEYGFLANVHVHKIKDVIRDFIILQTAPLFFILELPTNERDERLLRKSDTDTFHTDVYYIDGMNANEAIGLLDKHGELLIHDGISGFGFGTHDSSAEIMSSKYNVVTLFVKSHEAYNNFFAKYDIPRVEKVVTAWDTFTETTPGESIRIIVNGKDVFSLPKELKRYGIYFAERR